MMFATSDSAKSGKRISIEDSSERWKEKFGLDECKLDAARAHHLAFFG